MRQVTKRSSINWGGAFSILIVLLLLLVLPSMPAVGNVAVKAQPILVEMAAQQPEAVISVIVQKAVTDTRMEDMVAQLGGTVTLDLHIINGFAAELKAADVVQLAKADGVRWISWDAPTTSSACPQCIDTTNLKNAYIGAIRADKVWNAAPYIQGQGIGVAVVDSGVNPQEELYTVSGTNRLVASVYFNNGYNQNPYDAYGHGNHVAGVIGSNGRRSNGAYTGVAPMINIINVKISDDVGGATAKNVVAGLQWILDNKNTYNIKVVNLSLNSAVDESYHTNPIDAAAEILWFNKIVVVTSAGNKGVGALYPPANDPFVITVGAADDVGTASIADDVIPAFSAYGKTKDGFAKPDLVAPGKNIVSLMANVNSGLAIAHPTNVINANGAYYFKMSGTSMSTPMVTGAVALLLQDEPNLTPDQVKYRLMSAANKNWSNYNSSKAGAGYLDVYAAVTGTTTGSANTGIQTSKLLWTGTNTPTMGSVNWGSVNWGSVNWGSVNWGSVNWGSVNWGSDYWGQ